MVSDDFNEINAYNWANHDAINCACWETSGTASSPLIDTCYVHAKEVGGYQWPSIEFPFPWSAG